MRMTDPKVSCIVLSYNYGHFLGRCLDTVLGQPYQNLEVIVVDDGSTDNTPEVVQPYVERGVRYIRKENGGVTSAVNAGVAAATGKYFAIISADDEWTDERLVEPVRVLEENPQVGLVYSDMQVIDGKGSIIAQSYFDWNDFDPPSGNLLQQLFSGNVVSGGTLVCRTELRDLWHPIPEYLKAEDWYIAFRVACEREIRYVPVRAIRYRQHGANMNLGQTDRTPLVLDDLMSRRLLLAHPIVDKVDPSVFVPSIIAFTLNSPQTISALPVSETQRQEAIELAQQAVERCRDRDFVSCMRLFARAVAADPQNEQILAAAAATWETIKRRWADLDEVVARTFKPLAYAAEILSDSDLLREYTAAFSGSDDATLLVQAFPGDDLEELGSLAGSLGSDADMVAVFEDEEALAAVADCLLSRTPRTGPLAMLRPVATAAELQGMHACVAANTPLQLVEVPA
jgi:hypothetical protein